MHRGGRSRQLIIVLRTRVTGCHEINVPALAIVTLIKLAGIHRATPFDGLLFQPALVLSVTVGIAQGAAVAMIGRRPIDPVNCRQARSAWRWPGIHYPGVFVVRECISTH